MGDEEGYLGQQVTGADTVHQRLEDEVAEYKVAHKGQRQNAPGPAGAAEEQQDRRQRDPDKPGIAQPGKEEHDGIPGRSVQALQGSEKLQFSVHKGSFFMSSLFLGWTVSSIPFVALTERQAPPPFGSACRCLFLRL